MGISRHPEKVKLIIGLLFSDNEKYQAVKGRLVKLFGGIDFESAVLDFTHTSYYAGEMGEVLKRRFLSFERLASLENIYTVKINGWNGLKTPEKPETGMQLAPLVTSTTP